MGLASIVFTKEPLNTFEVEGHKITVKKLTARDSLSMEGGMDLISGDKSDFKTMFTTFIDILSSVIVEVDGIKAESKADTKEFLLNLEQRYVSEIFNKAKVFGDLTQEDLKKA